MRASSLYGAKRFFVGGGEPFVLSKLPAIQFDIVTPPPSRVGTPVSERTTTPFLDERGPKTQLILLNRKASLPSVSLFSAVTPPPSSHFKPNSLKGEATTSTVVAETEACNDRSLFKAEDSRTRPRDKKHELSFTSLQLLFFNFRLSNCFRSPVTHKRQTCAPPSSSS